MKLEQKPNRWSCLLTSFAMAFDMPTAALQPLVGHDGGSVLWPDLPEPQCRRGFHPHEFTRLALEMGLSVTPLELIPSLCPNRGAAPKAVQYGGPGQLTYARNWAIFTGHIQGSRGVITGVGRTCGHAVAYGHGRIYDPDGEEYDYTQEACESRGFITHCLWRVDRISGKRGVR